MDDKDRKLLYKDLCARLPYGVVVCYDDGDPYHKADKITLEGIDMWNELVSGGNGNFPWELEHCKPYLRSLKNRTPEEREFLDDLSDSRCTPRMAELKIDYYLEHHLDYRGLIEKGLAIEAPDDVYVITKRIS